MCVTMEEDVDQDVEETQSENVGIDSDNTEPEVTDNSEEDEDAIDCEENSPEEVQEDKKDDGKDDSDDVDMLYSSYFDIDDCVKDKQTNNKGASDDDSTVHDEFHLGRVVRNHFNRIKQVCRASIIKYCSRDRCENLWLSAFCV